MSQLTQAPLGTDSITLQHADHIIIEDLSVQFPKGKVTAIVGPNGCGKSTLLNGLSRVHHPSRGQIVLQGKDIHKLPPREVARKLALLPQETSAPDGISVRELIRFGRHPHQSFLKQWGMDDKTAIEFALRSANLEDLGERLLDTLSGGQRQRAWIAMSIAQETPLLLLDEPTSALDLGHQIEVFDLIRDLSANGKTVVMVVHDLAMAARYSDHLIAMKAGKIVAQGSPKEVITPAILDHLYGVQCDLMEDPRTGAPILINVRRSPATATPDAGAASSSPQRQAALA
ncbi:putative siderophore transport system ATP-binding protein YusV [Marinomonas aquimarina]|uniref:Putative siderophore transport system ATP-binding protein YusV n=1 Tax=Marinomonas aquimarina TaxID=295068 RepID=A0A1A8T9Y1_9GAMM|nr:ABC transporter ATP-binding protein [Marinomonas aquimarina]SBS28238.1 putative siderophore transport system ATP-binding protein YusV [Marinomonas aquimarina]